MSTRRILGPGLCLSVLLLALTPAALADGITAPGQYYYYYFDQPVQMDLDLSRIAVLSDQADAQQVARDVASGTGLPVDGVEHLAFDRWYTIAVPMAQRDASAISSKVQSAAALRSGGFVSPMFMDSRGLPLAITRDILVQFKEDVSPERATDILTAAGVGTITDAEFAGLPRTYRVRSHANDGFTVLTDANMLAQMPEVAYAEPDKLITGTLAYTPNDPYYGQLWGLNQTNNIDVNAPQAWDIQQGDPNVFIVVMDLGVQYNHPDLNLRAGQDFTGRNVANGGPYNSCDNHGTEVAGCITAKINNALGVVGVAPNCRVASAKIGEAIIPCNGYFNAQDSYLTSALAWASSIGAKISNSSFGWGSSATVTNAYATARSNGVLHFVASGNDGASTISYPSSLPSVNAVGAITSTGSRASFSNWGTGLDFSAPGANICTTDRTGTSGDATGDYVCGLDGTSFASPYACGVAALVYSMNPSGLTPANVETILQTTCTDLGTAGYDTTFGYGLLNASAAIATLTNPPGAFSLSTPAQALTAVSTNATFTWTASTNATDYNLTIDTDPNFTSHDAFTIAAITGTTYTLTGNPLRQETTYYWKVVAHNLAGTHGSTPASRSFTTFRDCDGNNQDDLAEIAASPALDCNGNGWLDSCDINGSPFLSASPYYSPMDGLHPQQYTLTSPPTALGTVTLSFTAFGDLNFYNEAVAISINSTAIGYVFQNNGVDCDWVTDTLTITDAQWNTLKSAGTAVIHMAPDGSVDPNWCPAGSYIRATVSYTRAPTAQDSNHNGVPDQCEAGACCATNGTCTVSTAAACASAGGTYQGNGTVCSPNPCPQPTGACCQANGSCTVLTAAACTTAGGTYQGNGTVCSPNPCPQPTGACCQTDGSCTVLTAAACTTAGGTYQGNGTVCSPNPCPQPTGACCQTDGSCTVLTAAACTTAGGTYQGNGTVCSPNPCPQPTGACCQAGTCTTLTAADCTAGGGTYQGNGTTCTPNPCAPVVCRGDGNCDGTINWRDIDYLIAGQNDNQSAWQALFASGPTCPFTSLDTNSDGHVNWRDIDPFIALMNTTCPH